MKDITNKILSKIISFDNTNIPEVENDKLNEIIDICRYYQRENYQADLNKESDSQPRIPDGFEPINIPGNKNVKDYYVNRKGEIYSGKRQIYMKLSLNYAGYLQFGVCGPKGKLSFVQVHRAVACTFLPNPEGLPIIHHKDHDKTNNNIENLEWCTHKDNSLRYHEFAKNAMAEQMEKNKHL